MVLFAVDDDGDHFPDYEQPDQGDSSMSDDEDGLMSDDEDSSLDEQSDQEDDMSMSDDNEDSSFDDEQSDEEVDVSMPDADGGVRHHHQQDRGDRFMASLRDAIRSYTDRGFHAAAFSENYYFLDRARRRHRRRSRMFPAADEDYSVEEEDDYQAPAPPAAASEAAIAALEAAQAPADDCCPVCLQEEDGAWSRVAPCGHRFHAACVARWLRVKLSCPVCRRPAAAWRRDDGAAAEPRRRPIPAIVEEALAMSCEEFAVFERSARWLEFMASFNEQPSVNNSSEVSAVAA